MSSTIVFDFLALSGAERRVAFEKAAFFFAAVAKDGDTTEAIERFKATYMTKPTAQEEPKKQKKKKEPVPVVVTPVVKKEPSIVKSVPLTQPTLRDTLKAILANMQDLGVEKEADADAILEIFTEKGELDYRMRNLLQSMADVAAVYSANFTSNMTLQKKAGELGIATSDNRIKKVIVLVDGTQISADETTVYSANDAVVLDGELTIAVYTSTAMNYMLFCWHILQVVYGRKSLTVPKEASTIKEEWRKDRNGIKMAEVFKNVFSKANKLEPLVSAKASIDQIKNQLEVVETLDQFYDAQSKTFNVGNVYRDLLSPLNTLYHQYKSDIENPAANDALHRLTNFGIFQRFPDNVAMQTKYLHSMSIAANMLISHLMEGDVEHEDIERARTEWPFETAAGAAMEI